MSDQQDPTPSDAPEPDSGPDRSAPGGLDDAAGKTTRGAVAIRRTKIVAAVLMAAAAAAFWAASRLTWATVFAGDGMSPDRYMTVKGADWSPWLTPLALVLLAAILAAFSLRGWALRILAVLVAAGGVLAAFPALSMATSGSDSLYAARAIDLADRYVVRLTTTNAWVAIVVLAGTLCCVGAGVLLMRAASGAGMSSKYRTPAARREELERQVFADYERRRSGDAESAGDDTSADGSRGTSKADPKPQTNERMMWDALDTGIDPTDPH
ncbi:TIGR02234 family membrane protein [Gordonia sp. NPDC003376]